MRKLTRVQVMNAINSARGARSIPLLMEVDLREIDLSDLDLSGVNLRGSNLTRADLSRSNLNQTDLREAIIVDTKLVKTNLAGALMGYTIFGNIDLRQAEGLESVKHLGPSIIGVDTISRSSGTSESVRIFFRAAGVLGAFISCIELKLPPRSLESTASLYPPEAAEDWFDNLKDELKAVSERLMSHHVIKERQGQSYSLELHNTIKQLQAEKELIETELKRWRK